MPPLPPVCLELQNDVKRASSAIDRIKEQIQQLQSEILELSAADLQYSPLKGNLVRLKLKLEGVEGSLKAAQLRLRNAENKFFESGLKLCGKPNACVGDKLAQRLWTLSLPKQVTSTTKLIQEATELTNQIDDLKQSLKECLYEDLEAELNDANRTSPFPFDAGITLFNRQIVINTARNSPCASPQAKAAIITILSNDNNYSRQSGRPLLDSAVRLLTVRNLQDIAEREKIWAQLLSNEHPDQIYLANLEDQIEENQDPDSKTNQDLREKFLDMLVKITKECIQENASGPNPFSYSSSTVVTATAGPGAAEGGDSVTKTLEDHGCIIFNDTTFLFSLDTMKAIEALGPGGCYTKQNVLVEGAFVPAGPYWAYPVNITSTITLTNTHFISNIIGRFKANIESTNSLEPLGGEDGGYWPTLTLNDPIILTTCVAAPK